MRLSFFIMQGYNMCRRCYFSSHYTLGLKGSAAVVTLARVAWHILKWPPALSLGVLTLSFTSFSHWNSLCYSLHLRNSSLCLLWSYLLCPSLSSAFLPPHLCLLPLTPIPFHPVISPFSVPFSQRTPMFSVGPDYNCKWSGWWFYFRNFAIIPSI